MERIKKHIQFIYPEQSEKVYKDVMTLIKKWKDVPFKDYKSIDEQDVVLICYGDAIHEEDGSTLPALTKFLAAHVKDVFSTVHLLPIYPYTSDDGFAVVDFREVDKRLGNWNDIKNLGNHFDLMLDAVVNHVSQSSSYFKEFLKCNPDFENFFIVSDPGLDYSSVSRPRALPLLTPFQTEKGIKYVWTTFSDDQIDLNFKEPGVLLEFLDVLLFYAHKGSRFIRLDAIGFIWKELNTTCMHLPQTHEIIKLARAVLEYCAKGSVFITETNVAHSDNISYFGNGYDEASLVYQFPLPPLTLYSFLTGNASKLTKWAASLEETTEATSFFNFLASHDGIGLRPTEGILTDEERLMLVEETQKRGGLVGWRTLPDGTKTAYEMNINYMDAISEADDPDEVRCQKMLAAHAILLSIAGMPAIYYHSLFGSRNNREEAIITGINRRINREKLLYDILEEECLDTSTLRNRVFFGMKEMLRIRRTNSAFHPNEGQEILDLDTRVFALTRGSGGKKVLAAINVSKDKVDLGQSFVGRDLMTNESVKQLVLEPYSFKWIELL